jgi:uncharacterized tellurite resistance protein B-like protein
MKLNELDADETLALVALCNTIVHLDRKVSAEEAEAIPALIDAIGEDRYRTAFAEARARFADTAALEAFLGSTGRPEARALIHATLLRLARADGLAPEECELLDHVSLSWNLL